MILSIVLGALVGIIMGLTGAGGGILAVPLLVFGLGLSVAQAGPIGLMAVGIAAAMGAAMGLRAKVVRYRAALLIAGVGMLVAPLGAWLAQRVDTRFLSLVFALVLLWVAYKTFRESAAHGTKPGSPGRATPPCIRDAEDGRFIWTSKCAGALSLSGSLAGALSGLLGVGGGFVMVPALQRYTDLAMQSVVATSLAVIALISLAGVVTSISAGHFNLAVGLPFSAGALAGMAAGSMLSSRLPTRYLKIAFAGICVVVAAGMIAKSL
ncbi:sulfite exporter TauE/SafE family protein [Noviherbaspirillum galbum]|uniref:Probable membrane transporter protein n=1 Tax=Noviherbaspirillum galbum TaxID=2709383 RepID=A0A6B3SJF3_9BURK|nr:sulfite exporter TauE/SafE family protein [Noviherbaspirillum galbum]NEX60984.1 sulfite exporter TauE/SafE family protein [Noviherbaspirillum galbum]